MCSERLAIVFNSMELFTEMTFRATFVLVNRAARSVKNDIRHDLCALKT